MNERTTIALTFKHLASKDVQIQRTQHLPIKFYEMIAIFDCSSLTSKYLLSLLNLEFSVKVATKTLLYRSGDFFICFNRMWFYHGCVFSLQVRVMIKHMLNHPNLEELDLSFNKIGDKGARAVGKLINNSKITRLNLLDNQIGHQGMAAIAHALKKPTALKHLNLRLNRCTIRYLQIWA